MSRRVYLVDRDLELEYVEPQTGAPTSGWVVNGAWHWRRVGDTEFACRTHRCRNEDAVSTRHKLLPSQWVGLRYKHITSRQRALAELLNDNIPF